MPPTRITATELARNLSDILNRVRYRGERFDVLKNGELVAELSPAAAKQFTVRDFIDLMERLPPADDKWADDLEEIHNSQGVLPPLPEWP
jgi:antitoxin (DNA-binding transcriptional repressor) of toxin-antitoxin stability system